MTFTNMLGLVIRTVACTSEMCGGQPPMCPVRTPGLATSRPESESHRQVHSLHFTNAAAEPARLEWIASNGSIGAVLVTLAPGQTRGVSARTGDVFTASGSNSGLMLMELFTGPAIVRECSICPDAPLVLCPLHAPQRYNVTERPAYEPAGFINFAPDAVDVYQVDSHMQCEKRLTGAAGPVETRGQLHFASRRGQRFRARRRRDQRLLLEHVVGEVMIRPCVAPTGSDVRRQGGVDHSLARVVFEIREALARQEERSLELRRVVEALHNQTSTRIDALAHSLGAPAALVPEEAERESDAQRVEISTIGGTWLK